MTTFLVVDDDADLRYLVHVAITRAGHRALSAASIEEARTLCAAERPDVLLLDVTMPEMDGPAFLAALRDEELAPPHVFLLSALEPDQLAALAGSLDVRFLLKPFTLQSLRTGLADFLETPDPPAVPGAGEG